MFLFPLFGVVVLRVAFGGGGCASYRFAGRMARPSQGEEGCTWRGLGDGQFLLTEALRAAAVARREPLHHRVVVVDSSSSSSSSGGADLRFLDADGLAYPFRCDTPKAMPALEVFVNATADFRGLVFERETCEYVEHSACPNETPLNMSKAPRKCLVVEEAVSLATMNKAVFHVMIEASLGLAALGDPRTFRAAHPGAVFHIQSDRYHVTEATSTLIRDWLAVLGWGPDVIDERQLVINECVDAQRLILPELPYCGYPSQPQVDWLYSRVRASLLDTDDQDDDDQDDDRKRRRKKEEGKKQRKVLLMTRTKTRVPSFWPQVRAHLLERGYEILDHDDGRRLGPVRAQLQRVAEAGIIVAPHGAGLVTMAALPPGGCVVEFIRDDSSFNLCFVALGAKLNLTYSATAYKPDDDDAHLDFLDDALTHCDKYKF